SSRVGQAEGGCWLNISGRRSNAYRATRGKRLLCAQSCHGRANDFFERNWWRSIALNRSDESCPFGCMAFILADTGTNRLLPSVANKFETTKIFQHRGAACAEDLNSFF